MAEQNVHVVKLHQDSDRRKQALFGQRDHHLKRRLQAQSFASNIPNETDSDILEHGVWNWRRSLNEGDGVGSVPLSNCELLLWAGDIQIGTPAQTFTVHFDTGSFTLWVADVDCHGCDPSWRRFDESLSSTFDDAHKKPFVTRYADGEMVEGEFVHDVVSFGDFLTIEHQLFGRVTNTNDLQSCSEEGIIGLGLQERRGGYPTIVHNLKGRLNNNIFSMYLDKTEDFPSNPQEGPQSAHSEIVFGGVNHKHYNGCLVWHNVGHFHHTRGSMFDGYWDLKLKSVKVGDEEFTTSHLALVDSGSSYVVGPPSSVGWYAQQVGARCYSLENMNHPVKVDCYDDSAIWDAAAIDCNGEDFDEIVFEVDDSTYSLGRSDLIDVVQTRKGQICLLRMIGFSGIPGWVLGDAFLNKYYTAYDFGRKRVGFAEATKNRNGHCEEDYHLDISYQGENDARRLTGDTLKNKEAYQHLGRLNHSNEVFLLAVLAIFAVLVVQGALRRR